MDPERLVAIGNFDGVHIGHRHLVTSVVAEASERGLVPTVLTFEPHPAVVVGREPPPLLTPRERKVQLLEAISPALSVSVLAFDHALSQMSPRQFADEILRRRYNARVVIVGENFRFGRQRAGDLATLRGLGEELGFAASACLLLQDAGGVVSSTRVRSRLSAGDVQGAAALLGRPHRLVGQVVKGRQLGRRLGFPTANLAGICEMLPGNGVYACRAVLPARGPEPESFDAVVNVGIRPTVDGREVSVEAHLLTSPGDLYGQELALDFVGAIRPEIRFDDLEALRQQIGRDVEVARVLLAGPALGG